MIWLLNQLRGHVKQRFDDMLKQSKGALRFEVEKILEEACAAYNGINKLARSRSDPTPDEPKKIMRMLKWQLQQAIDAPPTYYNDDREEDRQRTLERMDHLVMMIND